MGSGEREKFDNPVMEWIDSRMPIFTMLVKEYGVFPAPKNFNYFWNFGAIALFMLVTMIVTGLFLAMHYTADTKLAFDSVERIMRDVNGGWLIRYIHMNGASFFFIAVYIHMFRGMYYGSYKRPRELLWILGVVIFLLMMATAFLGYVLPWGQMSLWGATVITGFFTAIPFVGEWIQTLLLGGYSVDNPTLTRFFALHFVLPFVIFAVVVLHVWALHVTGSNNPLGIDTKGPQDTLPFHPYYTIKDTFGLLVFMVLYAVFIFYMPNALGHPDNYIPANPLVTPPHIVPEWYFLPFYAILRAVTFGTNWYLIIALVLGATAFVKWMFANVKGETIFDKKYRLFLILAALFAVPGALLAFVPATGIGFVETLRHIFTLDFLIADNMRATKEGLETRAFLDMMLIPVSAKLGGVLAMFGSIAVLFVLPWLDNHPLRSARFRPLFRIFILLFTVNVFVLGYVGALPADATIGSALSTLFWGTFSFLLLIPYLADVPLSLVGLASTGYYFAFFLVILPLLGRYEKGRALPASISEAVLQKKGGKHAMIAVLFAGVLTLSAPAAQAADGHGTAPIPQQAWTFEGPFGTFDKASLQRGYKVYREVCAACHSMKKIYFRNLEDLGYNASQIKNIAKEYSYEDGPNEEGDMFERPGLPSDPFKSPFANDNAARYANGGALPPDLSLITKARADGSNYLTALLTGYEEPPHGETLAQGQYWNKYFSGHKIGMAPPLSTDLVAYEDGTPQTVEQYARDVAHFLTWAAEPHMEARKQTGFKVIIFLLVFAGIMYGVKRKIWAHLH